MESYREMRERHQNEFNALPIRFAFDKEQFLDMMSKFGLQPEETDKLYAGPAGSYYKKSDASKIHEFLKMQTREMEEAMQNEDFACGAFKCEMENHEFSYTWELDETLYSLDLNMEDVLNNQILKSALNRALMNYNTNLERYIKWGY